MKNITYVLLQESTAHQCIIIKMEDGELVGIAGPVFRSEISSYRPGDPATVETFNFTGVRFTGRSEKGWDEVRRLTEGWKNIREYTFPA